MKISTIVLVAIVALTVLEGATCYKVQISLDEDDLPHISLISSEEEHSSSQVNSEHELPSLGHHDVPSHLEEYPQQTHEEPSNIPEYINEAPSQHQPSHPVLGEEHRAPELEEETSIDNEQAERSVSASEIVGDDLSPSQPSDKPAAPSFGEENAPPQSSFEPLLPGHDAQGEFVQPSISALGEEHAQPQFGEDIGNGNVQGELPSNDDHFFAPEGNHEIPSHVQQSRPELEEEHVLPQLEESVESTNNKQEEIKFNFGERTRRSIGDQVAIGDELSEKPEAPSSGHENIPLQSGFELVVPGDDTQDELPSIDDMSVPELNEIPSHVLPFNPSFGEEHVPPQMGEAIIPVEDEQNERTVIVGEETSHHGEGVEVGDEISGKPAAPSFEEESEAEAEDNVQGELPSNDNIFAPEGNHEIPSDVQPSQPELEEEHVLPQFEEEGLEAIDNEQEKESNLDERTRRSIGDQVAVGDELSEKPEAPSFGEGNVPPQSGFEPVVPGDDTQEELASSDDISAPELNEIPSHVLPSNPSFEGEHAPPQMGEAIVPVEDKQNDRTVVVGEETSHHAEGVEVGDKLNEKPAAPSSEEESEAEFVEPQGNVQGELPSNDNVFAPEGNHEIPSHVQPSQPELEKEHVLPQLEEEGLEATDDEQEKGTHFGERTRRSLGVQVVVGDEYSPPQLSDKPGAPSSEQEQSELQPVVPGNLPSNVNDIPSANVNGEIPSHIQPSQPVLGEDNDLPQMSWDHIVPLSNEQKETVSSIESEVVPQINEEQVPSFFGEEYERPQSGVQPVIPGNNGQDNLPPVYQVPSEDHEVPFVGSSMVNAWL